MALTLKHQTTQQFLIRFWIKVKEAYQANDKLGYSKLIWKLYKRIQDGDVTSNEARQSFNFVYSKSLNASEWNTLVSTKLIPIKDRYQAMLDEGDL